MASRRRTHTLDPQVDSVLRAVEVTHHAETMAAARKFELAASWAELHPGEDVVEVVDRDGCLVLYGDQPLALAGEGAPTVAEFCVPEFARAVGMSPVAGRKFIGAAIEAKHRLPKLWARAMRGEVPVWKVRRITEQTHRLPVAGATYVDHKLAGIAHDCSFAQIEGITRTAVEEFDHDRFEELRKQRTRHQHLDVDVAAAPLNSGLVPVSGLLEMTDALALEKAIKTTAHALLTDNPELDLDIRRAMSLGELADRALVGGDGSGARELVIYTHHDTRNGHGIVDLENTGPMGSNITIDQLADWCRQADTKVSVRPVLDLDEELCTDSYEPTARQREQAILTCPTCVFPGCSTSARRSDLDHITAWADGGATVVLEPRALVSPAPPTQDPWPLDLHPALPHHLRVDLPAGTGLPRRPLPRTATNRLTYTPPAAPTGPPPCRGTGSAADQHRASSDDPEILRAARDRHRPGDVTPGPSVDAEPGRVRRVHTRPDAALPQVLVGDLQVRVRRPGRRRPVGLAVPEAPAERRRPDPQLHLTTQQGHGPGELALLGVEVRLEVHQRAPVRRLDHQLRFRQWQASERCRN